MVSRQHAAARDVGGARGDEGKGRGVVGAADLRALEPAAEELAARRDDILASWRQQFDAALGADPIAPTEELALLLRRDLDGLVAGVRQASVAPFADAVRSVGGELLDRGLSFPRAAWLASLLAEATVGVLDRERPASERAALARLGHFRIVVLADQYFRCGLDSAHADAPLVEVADDGGAEAAPRPPQRYGLVGDSPPMRALYRAIEAASKGHGTVFIVGESGTGKELTARAVHAQSMRAERPLVVVNCAALPAGLFESELFGHTEGAYTGAQRSHAGLVRAAAGGALFLDEITEMPASVQAKLLRVLEEGTVRPVGTTQEIPAKVRFIASTNRDPEHAVRAGVLRADVYHRINVHRIDMPPLREHLDDIPALAYHFAQELAEHGFRPIKRFHADALALMQQYAWPGNVRELRNAVEVALTSGTGDTVRPNALPGYILRARPSGARARGSAVPTFAEAECSLIKRALAATSGNKRRAAQLLGISRHRLYDKIRKYGID